MRILPQTSRYVSIKYSASTNEWVQVDLGTSGTIKRIVTQGMHVRQYWMKSYKVKYGEDVNNLEFVQDQHGATRVCYII